MFIWLIKTVREGGFLEVSKSINPANSTPLRQKRWFILAVIILIPFMVTLDGTVVNVALPAISRDLKTTLEQAQLAVSVYLVAVVSTILLFGRLGDVIGKGKVFLFGVALFGIGSLAAGFSTSMLMLDLSRAVEGIGGAAAMANSQGIITEVFPSNERGRALGIVSIGAAVGTMLGPPIGGLIVTNLKWNYIFLINVPVALFSLIAGIIIFPKVKKTKQKIDFFGAGVLAAGLILFFIGLYTGERSGYNQIMVWIEFAFSVILLVSFFFWERHEKEPVLDFALFKNSGFRLAIFCVFIQFLVSGGVSILLPIFLEDAKGMSAAQSGLYLMAMPIAMGIASPIGGTLSDKLGSLKICLVGLSFMLIGIFTISRLTLSSSMVHLIVSLIFVGIGSGLFTAPNSSLIMGSAPKDKLGIAGSTNSFMRNFGAAIGVSVFSTILYVLMGQRVGHTVSGYTPSDPGAFIDSMQIVYLIGTAFVLLSVVLTALEIIRNHKGQEQRSSGNSAPASNQPATEMG